MAKLMTTYRAIERGSWKVKAEGKHGGAIGRSALRVLETFLFVLYRPGKALCLPYEGIAEAALLSRRTVPSAQLTDGFIVQPSTGSRPRPRWPRAPWPANRALPPSGLAKIFGDAGAVLSRHCLFLAIAFIIARFAATSLSPSSRGRRCRAVRAAPAARRCMFRPPYPEGIAAWLTNG
jgi:hypothetical protein